MGPFLSAYRCSHCSLSFQSIFSTYKPPGWLPTYHIPFTSIVTTVRIVYTHFLCVHFQFTFPLPRNSCLSNLFPSLQCSLSILHFSTSGLCSLTSSSLFKPFYFSAEIAPTTVVFNGSCTLEPPEKFVKVLIPRSHLRLIT